MARVLVVEDDAKIRSGLEQGLQAAGIMVRTAATAKEGGRLAASENFDCILLDWMLPEGDGLQVLSDLRRSGQTTPVLLLTARDAIEDRVEGLESGADDYLVKPFAFAELLARLRALLRRGRVESKTVLRAGSLELDLLRRQASRRGEGIDLTNREFELLEYLIRHKNEPVTREMLGLDVWKEPSYAYTNVIDVYINQIRKKIEIASEPPQIVTLRGVGYSLQE